MRNPLLGKPARGFFHAVNQIESVDLNPPCSELTKKVKVEWRKAFVDHRAYLPNALKNERSTAALDSSHAFYQRFTECRTRDFLRVGHLPRKVIGHNFILDGLLHRMDYQIGGLDPAHVPQHHFRRQDD